MGDTENSSSRSVDLVSRNQRLTLDVFNKVLCGLKELNDKDASLLGFEDELLTHFCRLPTRYAMDVNAERAEDVIMHKRLLQLAHNPDKIISSVAKTHLNHTLHIVSSSKSKNHSSHSKQNQISKV
ncbi:SERINE/THREONINE-PROTEIN KINASE STY46-LIKE [Salix koriyanagi]|uniref:SERINE/THREONINE-PROTEIN KINASE STY46-LIKE n=1 Tax=Salix koriyanagi TaxID=2511006 RepID=A0A9Q0WZM9_9ROSI|nr:SERINE/THREONINE-PROTEIN KINASE STY46-LIKE [Salix koriyanagi]